MESCGILQLNAQVLRYGRGYSSTFNSSAFVLFCAIERLFDFKYCGVVCRGGTTYAIDSVRWSGSFWFALYVSCVSHARLLRPVLMERQ